MLIVDVPIAKPERYSARIKEYLDSTSVPDSRLFMQKSELKYVDPVQFKAQEKARRAELERQRLTREKWRKEFVLGNQQADERKKQEDERMSRKTQESTLEDERKKQQSEKQTSTPENEKQNSEMQKKESSLENEKKKQEDEKQKQEDETKKQEDEKKQKGYEKQKQEDERLRKEQAQQPKVDLRPAVMMQQQRARLLGEAYGGWGMFLLILFLLLIRWLRGTTPETDLEYLKKL